MNKINHLLSLCLLILVITYPIHAKPTESNMAVDEVVFDLPAANKQLRKLTSSLASKQLSIKQLNRSIAQLNTLSDQAQDCVDKTANKIREIDTQIKMILGKEASFQGKEALKETIDKVNQSRVDSKYLNLQKKKLTNRQAKCQLLVIRAGEALKTYQSRALSLRQQITFTRGYSIFNRVEMVHKDIEKLVIPKIISPIAPWGWLFTGIFVIPLALIAFAIIYCIRSSLKKFVRRRSMGIAQTVLAFMALVIFSLWAGDYQMFNNEADNSLFQQILIELLVIISALLITQMIMAIRRLDISLKWYGFDTDFLRTLIQVIIIISGANYIGANILTLLESGQNLKQFYDSVLMMISLLATIYFAYRFYLSHQRFFAAKSHFIYINRFIWLIVFILIALDMTGFYILSVNAALIFFSLLLVNGLSLVILKGFAQAYHYLNYAPNSQAYLKRYFGYSSNPPHFELALLKFIFQVIIILALIYLFAYLIGEASYFIDNFLEYLISGFVIGNYSLKPLNWLVGVFIFCNIVILSRYISRRYSLNTLKDEEEDTQVAVASILLYIGFTVAVIMGLLFAGFNFTSLAIIAGALSVGIGLGLQSIVNNFFSGLILLIEKPIKVGDRIAIGEIEGFVKKVRVRSTQIQTPSREDIIIPNSDLITQQVTNFMFANRTWRVKCVVGVAYGSDTDLVREVLLEVARNHKDVLDTRGNKPRVIFQEFGDSALIFELWCMINNVNNKYNVLSDLNFAIDKAFRAHKIEIAFPQRDVHIKYEPPDNP